MPAGAARFSLAQPRSRVSWGRARRVDLCSSRRAVGRVEDGGHEHGPQRAPLSLARALSGRVACSLEPGLSFLHPCPRVPVSSAS